MSRRASWLALILACLGFLASIPASAQIIQSARVSPSRFSPNGDGVQDTAYVLFTAQDTVDAVFLQVYRPDGGLILTRYTAGPLAPGPASVAWDGRDSLGALQPEGAYGLVLGGVRHGQTERVPLSVVIDLTAPRIQAVSIQPNPLVLTPPPSTGGGGVDSVVTIQFTVTNFDTTQAGGDFVRLFVLHVPGENFDSLVGATRVPLGGSTYQFTALWTVNPDTLRDGVHTVVIETGDAAGNHDGGPLWALDVVANGPAIRMTRPPQALLIDPRGEQRIRLSAYPDSLGGTVRDRNGVQLMYLTYGSGDSSAVSLSGQGADTVWSSPYPTSPAERHEGDVIVTITAINRLNMVSRRVYNLNFDFTPPTPIQLFHPISGTSRRSLLVVAGLVKGADSLIAYVVHPDSSVDRADLQLFHRIQKVTDTTFTVSLPLQPGINRYFLEAKDFAGNADAPLTGLVNYASSAGLWAPEAFHSGDAFMAQLDRTAASFEARVYRPDGGFMRRLYTETSVDGTSRNFELPWDLKNENGALVGRGPFICLLRAIYADGTTEIRRLVVVVMP